MLSRDSLLIFVLALSVPRPARAETAAVVDAGPPVAAPATPPPKEPEARRLWLKACLDEILSGPSLGHARMSVAGARYPESGKTIYAKNEKAGLNAASNVKIATEAASLALLGPEFRWKTTLLGAIPPEGGKAISAGELRGDLYVKTSGDPTFSAQDLAHSRPIWRRWACTRYAAVKPLTPARSTAPPSARSSSTQRFRLLPRAIVGSLAEWQCRDSDGCPRGIGGRARAHCAGACVGGARARRNSHHRGQGRGARGRNRGRGNGQTRVTVTGRILIGAEPRVIQRAWSRRRYFSGRP